MRNNVKVTAKDGKVIEVSENNSEYGYIRVEQTRTIFDHNGWLKVKTLSALVPGKVEDLKNLNWKDGQLLPGKVYIREQMVPFSSVNPDKHIKIAGDSGVQCKVGEEPIYRNTFYTDNAGLPDVLIAHTNGAAIKVASTELQDQSSNLN